MTGLLSLIRRNCKLFFKDKGMFFSSLITPLILLLLYVTFLANVYRDSFASSIPPVFLVPQELIDATVGGQLVAALLAVCCITVAFCSNMRMVQDKVTKARTDLTMTPVHSATLSVGYLLSALLSTLIICLLAAGAGFIYLAAVGWYLSAADVALILLDVLLLSMFGTLLSGIVNFFLSSEGQISAVGTIVSAGYGFICGAYMPISQFGEGLQKALSFLPGTYGTALLKNHALRGVYAEMEKRFPDRVTDGIKTSLDCNPEFFGHTVSISAMYLVLILSIVALLGIYILVGFCTRKKR